MAKQIAMALVLVAAVSCARAEELRYDQLVNRLIDLHSLAELPPAGETSGMQSSYDRRSRYDAASGKYIDWYANDDGFTPQFIRKEGQQEVLAEMQGPGCIWRTWSANPKDGHVKIFLDGQTEPAVDLPFSGYFDGKNAPFNYPQLVYIASRGQNCYVPIPYAKSCKIVADPGWGQYYQFTYSTFAPGTQVPTFSRHLSADDIAALQHVNDRLAQHLGELPSDENAGEVVSKDVVAAAGQQTPVIDLSGEGAITSIRIKADFDNRADQIQTLRELTLNAAWDGETLPSVWSPLGDFFGTAMGVNAFRSLPSGMTGDGFYSYWYMPYGKGAKIWIGNDGARERKLHIEITHAPLDRPIGELARFHAKWHRDISPRPTADRWPDWAVLTTQGRGRFCGMMLHVWNPRAGHNWQYGREGGYWWGEGDEKFFVDGEKFPSTFGTGTEDYFGYAWCEPSLFQKAFHAQTLTQNNKGHQSVVRWQIADSVPFQKSFDGFLEKYYPNDFPTRYAVTAYWYLEAGGKDSLAPVPLANRTGYYDLTDATEGENLKILQCTAGHAAPQTLLIERECGESLFSGGSQLWWQGGKPGAKLTLAVPVARAGRFRVKVGTVAAADYGIVKWSFANQTPLGPVDLYNPDLRAAEVDLGEFNLPAGETPLTLEIIGANAKAKQDFMASVDYVKLLPVE